MAYSLPDDVDQRPVTIDGVGTLGRRIATVFAAGGSDVRIYATHAEQREAGRDYVEQHAAEAGLYLMEQHPPRSAQTPELRPERSNGVEVAGYPAFAYESSWLGGRRI